MKSFLNRFKRTDADEPPKPMPEAAPGSSEQLPARRTGVSITPEEAYAESEAVKADRARRAEPPPDEDLVLELGDFLHLMPAKLLRPGTPDVHLELRFPLAEVADRIARGETSIPMAQIYAKVPQIFVGPILETDPLEVRFPWQKVLKLINETAPGIVAASDSLALKLKTQQGKRNITMGRASGGLNVPESPLGKAGSKLAQRPVTWFSRPAASPPGDESSTEPAPSVEPEPEPATTSLDLKESTVLVESVREEFERELASVRADYERQIDALQAELDAFRSARGGDRAG